MIDSEFTNSPAKAAREVGARIISQQSQDCGHQEQVGEHGQNYWLLDLDADQAVSAELAEEIEGLFSQGEPDADVYFLRLIYVDPSGRVWRNSRSRYLPKLYDRRKVRHPSNITADELRHTSDLRVRRLNGALLHYAFNDVQHLSRQQKDWAIERARSIASRGSVAIALGVYIGLPYFFLRNYVFHGRCLEGRYGFLFSIVTAYYDWYGYAVAFKERLSKPG